MLTGQQDSNAPMGRMYNPIVYPTFSMVGKAINIEPSKNKGCVNKGCVMKANYLSQAFKEGRILADRDGENTVYYRVNYDGEIEHGMEH